MEIWKSVRNHWFINWKTFSFILPLKQFIMENIDPQDADTEDISIQDSDIRIGEVTEFKTLAKHYCKPYAGLNTNRYSFFQGYSIDPVESSVTPKKQTCNEERTCIGMYRKS